MALDIEEAIKSARAIVGEHKPDDYLLKPNEHADQFKDSAAALADLLRMERFSDIASEYAENNGQAILARARFERVSKTANVAVLAAAVASALMMAAEILSKPQGTTSEWFPSLLGDLVPALGVLSAVSAAIAGAALAYIRNGKLLEDWMGKRALAETARLGYFSEFTLDPKPVELDLLTLEYFRRFQCDMQRAFYGTRGPELRRSAGRTMLWALAGVFLSTLAGGLGGGASIFEGQAAALAAVAVIGAAVSAFAAAREAMTQDGRTADRYDRALKVLRGIVSTRIGDVRRAVAAGEHAPLVEFVKAVNEHLSLEHREWLESGEAAKEGLVKLDAALEAAGKKKE